MRHSDKQTDFGTGAQRDTDEGKGKPSLISPVLIHRLGILLAEGAKHYGADNWMKGMPYRRTADSMIRHIFQWLAGDTKDDHLAAICFGAMCLMHYEADTNLDIELDDRREEEMRKILPSILTSSPKDATVEGDLVKCGNKTRFRARREPMGNGYDQFYCPSCGHRNPLVFSDSMQQFADISGRFQCEKCEEEVCVT